MRAGTKRALSFGVAALALLCGAMGSAAAHRFHDRGMRTLAAQLAGNARMQAKSALTDKLKMIETQATSAAGLPQIRGQLANFDGATLRDGFRSEAWWAPFRSDYSVYGVANERETLEVVEGMEAPDLDAHQLIADARAHRQASALLRAGTRQWPYLAGASVIDVPGRALPAVIFLAQAIDQAFAQDLVSRAGGAVLLSDGKTALLSAGPEAQQKSLATAVGKEAQPLLDAEDASWAAAQVPLLPGLSFWVYAEVGAQAEEYRKDDSRSRLGVWALALIIAGLAAFQGIRGQGGPGQGAPGPGLPAAPVAVPTAQPGRGDSAATGERPGSAGTTPLATAALGGTGATAPGGTGSTAPASAPDSEDATSIQKAPPRAPAANVFGRYVLLDRLGEGGMAEVFTAVTYGVEGFRRHFVVKRLRPEMARNTDVVAAFIDEANLASSLVHTNIVPVFDFGKVGDEYYMAQEYILGRDLGRVNRRSLERDGKPLPQNQVFFVAHETLRALDYAHGKLGPDKKPINLVHRDVSPNNILISARGEVKLFDFGIAKASNRITQTAFGMVKGNVRFMSPEQARGDETVDSRSDLFAVGLVIYYALSGDALYGEGTAYNLLVRAAQGPGAKELANLAKLPLPVQRVLERALQPAPADRFQTAAEFAQALAPFIAGAHDGLARSMERLFDEDIKAEEARFASAAAAGMGSEGAAPAGESGATAQQATNQFARPPGKA